MLVKDAIGTEQNVTL